MKFPKRVKHRGRVYATIYNKSAKYPLYRVVWMADGKRKMQGFARFGGDEGASRFAEGKAKELSQGSPAASLTRTQASDALAAFKVLQRFQQNTGNKLSLHEMASEFVDAKTKLNSHSIREAVEGFLRNIVSVKRKGLADAGKELIDADEPRTRTKEGARPQLSPEYFRIRNSMLNRFVSTFPGYAACDLTKENLDVFFTSKPLSDLSPKYRNHHRVAIRQFFAWCVRKDYLSPTHRLNEANSMRQEVAESADVHFYTPKEFRALLEAAQGRMLPLVAIGGHAGLRTAELLRLAWGELWKVTNHVEVSKSKGKTRQRRLVEMCGALQQLLSSFRDDKHGLIWTETESVFQKQFATLCEDAGVKRKENGLRHSFCTYHFALHSNENLTAAQAGNSPAMIHAHYKGLATKTEAEAWFGVAPGKAENVIPLRAAVANEQ